MGLTQHWYLWCSLCSNWENKAGNKISCIIEFKKGGWKKVGDDWLCPDCLKNSLVERKGSKKPKKSH